MAPVRLQQLSTRVLGVIVISDIHTEGFFKQSMKTQDKSINNCSLIRMPCFVPTVSTFVELPEIEFGGVHVKMKTNIRQTIHLFHCISDSIRKVKIDNLSLVIPNVFRSKKPPPFYLDIDIPALGHPLNDQVGNNNWNKGQPSFLSSTQHLVFFFLLII